MDLEIKDTNASLKNVMASASAQFEQQQVKEAKVAARQAVIRGVIKGFACLVAVGLLTAGFIYREELGAVVDEYKAEKQEAKTAVAVEEESAGDRMRKGLDIANYRAEQRDAILEEIHTKGMKK